MVEFEGAHLIGHGGGAFFRCSHPPGRETAGLHVPWLQVHKSCSMRQGQLLIKKFTKERFLGEAWWKVDIGCRRSTDFQRRTARCESVNASLGTPRSDISGYIG